VVTRDMKRSSVFVELHDLISSALCGLKTSFKWHRNFLHGLNW